MIAMISLAAAAVFALIGCASLALRLPSNWRLVMNEPLAEPTGSRLARWSWAALSSALIVCISRDGVGFAVLMWPLLFAVSAVTVAMTLSYRPKILRRLGRRVAKDR